MFEQLGETKNMAWEFEHALGWVLCSNTQNIFCGEGLAGSTVTCARRAVALALGNMFEDQEQIENVQKHI